MTDLADLLDEARCLLIGPIRICTKGHLVSSRDADALAERIVCGAGNVCDGTLRRGFLLEGEDMHPLAIIAGLIEAVEQRSVTK